MRASAYGCTHLAICWRLRSIDGPGAMDADPVLRLSGCVGSIHLSTLASTNECALVHSFLV